MIPYDRDAAKQSAPRMGRGDLKQADGPTWVVLILPTGDDRNDKTANFHAAVCGGTDAVHGIAPRFGR